MNFNLQVSNKLYLKPTLGPEPDYRKDGDSTGGKKKKKAELRPQSSRTWIKSIPEI